MFASILGWLLSMATGPFVGKVLDILAKKTDDANTLKLETLHAITADGGQMADLNKAKLGFPWFWVLISLFVGPLALWWSMVILDSIFSFPFTIADLPTVEMRQWAGDMIRWLFYVGTTTLALKVISK